MAEKNIGRLRLPAGELRLYSNDDVQCADPLTYLTDFFLKYARLCPLFSEGDQGPDVFDVIIRGNIPKSPNNPYVRMGEYFI